MLDCSIDLGNETYATDRRAGLVKVSAQTRSNAQLKTYLLTSGSPLYRTRRSGGLWRVEDLGEKVGHQCAASGAIGERREDG